MGTNTKDRQITRDEDFCCGLLVLRALKICTGMNCVLARPASRTEEGVETVRVSPLISVRNDLPSETPVPLAGVGNPPLNDPWIERHFQESHEFFDLLCCVMSRSIPAGRQNWRYGMLVWLPGEPFVCPFGGLMGISKRRIKGAEFLAGRLVAYAALLLKLSLITKNVI
jgi:hypothetical protein